MRECWWPIRGETERVSRTQPQTMVHLHSLSTQLDDRHEFPHSCESASNITILPTHGLSSARHSRSLKLHRQRRRSISQQQHYCLAYFSLPCLTPVSIAPRLTLDTLYCLLVHRPTTDILTKAKKLVWQSSKLAPLVWWWL